MHLVLSGEGNSDIGKLSYDNGSFEPAPMYWVIDKIFENKLDYSCYDLTPENITFIPKSKLIEEGKKIRFISGKKNKQGTGLFFKNALGLSKITKEKIKEMNDEVLAILFRDSDIHDHDEKVKSIENAFEQEDINGIAMIPRPKSEAWLICALKDKAYESCEKLEDRSGNDDSPHNLKDELSEILKSKNKTYYNINNMIQNNEIDIEKIDMPSFKYFKNKLENILS